MYQVTEATIIAVVLCIAVPSLAVGYFSCAYVNQAAIRKGRELLEKLK